MTSTPRAFFTVERGSATTSAGLVGRLGGRWRLLAATAAPASLDVEALLGEMVARVQVADGDAVDDAGWRDWVRLESRTVPPPGIVVAAPSERRLGLLVAQAADAGWRIAGRISPDRTDALVATDALLDSGVRAVLVLGTDAVPADERAAAADIGALVGAVTTRRSDLTILVAGAAPTAAAYPPGRVVTAPAPLADRDPGLASALERLAEEVVARDLAAAGPGHPDGRRGFVRSIASLAAVLDVRVEGIDVGLGAGTRAVAGTGGLEVSTIRAEAGLVPDGLAPDDRVLDQVVSWAPVREELYALRDRVRNLRLAPWRDAAGDGARLRLAAGRAALERLDRVWRARGGSADRASGPDSTAPDLLVVAGGCFAAAPAPAVALALVDTIRRPGAIALALDHARLLGPLGTLDDEADRQRLLADLADDALLPLGSCLLVPGLRTAKRARLRLSSDGATSDVALSAGGVQVVDLPPGATATAELDSPDDLGLGVRARHVMVTVAGGLGGLLVDTRDIPLRLPDRADRRREALESSEAPVWTGGDA